MLVCIYSLLSYSYPTLYTRCSVIFLTCKKIESKFAVLLCSFVPLLVPLLFRFHCWIGFHLHPFSLFLFIHSFPSCLSVFRCFVKIKAGISLRSVLPSCATLLELLLLLLLLSIINSSHLDDQWIVCLHCFLCALACFCVASCE